MGQLVATADGPTHHERCAGPCLSCPTSSSSSCPPEPSQPAAGTGGTQKEGSVLRRERNRLRTVKGFSHICDKQKSALDGVSTRHLSGT